MDSGNKSNLTKLAKDLRRRSTEAERALWAKLCRKQICGLKFRRQRPLGPYIVDFVCFERKVVIEIDGGQHAIEKDKDRQRDAWLVGEGFQILRFWNHEVLGNLDGVLQVLWRELSTPSPSPSHQGRGT